ncbi:MAG: DUF2202 domain-containing protein [Candidatus Paceibacteria bacterium]
MNNKIFKVLLVFTLVVTLSGCSLETEAEKVLSLTKNGATSFDQQKLEQVLERKKEMQKPLGEEVEMDLIYLIEEEKVARDLSYKFSQKYDEKIFTEVYKAENTHLKAVQRFIRNYKLDDPTSKNGVGEFKNPQLQKIYDEKLSSGKENKNKAYQSLLWVLEKNINDININKDSTDKDDILFVYNNLIRSSKNHIRAIDSLLSKEGGSYSPEHLSKAKYESIISSDIDSGSWW